MHALYLACLIGGALATALFTVLGGFGGAHGAHVGGHHVGTGVAHAAHLHLGHGHAPAGQAAHGQAGHVHGSHSTGSGVARAGWASTIAGCTLSWLSPLTVAAAALWFGGIGLLTESPLGGLALLPAILAAVLGAILIRTFMAQLFQASTPPLESGAEGALATVNATIRPDGAGEVIFSLEGLTRSSPARSLDGAIIPRGTSVAIVKKERGMAWVAPLDDGSVVGVLDDLQPVTETAESPR